MDERRPVAIRVYVGTYTPPAGKAQGIGVYELALEHGDLRLDHEVPGIESPSFLLMHPQAPYLYAANELETFAGQPGGAVTACGVAPTSGDLTPLVQQPVHGAAPCHLCLDRTARWLLVANYSSGSVTVLPVAADGRVGPATEVVQHSAGSGAGPDVTPHAHSSIQDPSGRHFLVADLGLDQILIYRLDTGRGVLIPSSPPFVSVQRGSGPRHLAFHPNGRYLYCTNEYASTVTAFAYDAERGVPSEIQSVSALPAGFAGQSFASHLALAPSGDFLYAANRGHDSLACFAVDRASGRLTLLSNTPVAGQYPRHFALDPTGQFLLVANQNSDGIARFRVDPDTGALALLGVTTAPTPVYIQFARLPA